MKKNFILYVVAGAVVLAGLVAGGVVVGKKVLNQRETTTEAITQAFNEEVTPVDDYIVPEETEAAELMTDEDGNMVELVTNKEGKTLQAVIETKANGEMVTKANGEKVTKKPTETKKVAPAATTKAGEKATTKKTAATTKTASNQKAGTNGTLVYNDDGTASIVKSDGTVALNYSYSEAGNYFYTDDNPWQRSLGFNRLYDMGAAFTCMYYDTVRVKYSYGNYDWMIQMWKGQYGLIFIGSEIGLYYKDKSKSTEHYNCATEDMELNMQMTLYRNGAKLFTRPYAPHWWITAFVPGKLTKFSDRSELIMIGKITFKSEGERSAFVNALTKIKDIDGNQFKQGSTISINNPETYKVNGNTVDFVWRYFDADRKTPVKKTEPETTTKKPEPETTTKKPEPETTTIVTTEPETTTEYNMEAPLVD